MNTAPTYFANSMPAADLPYAPVWHPQQIGWAPPPPAEPASSQIFGQVSGRALVVGVLVVLAVGAVIYQQRKK